MEIIRLSGYTHHEKLAIGQQFLVPKQQQDHGLEDGEDRLRGRGDRGADRALHPRGRRPQPGARDRLASAARSPARWSEEGSATHDHHRPPEGPRAPRQGQVPLAARSRQESEIGVATGLAWTEVGGEILSTEVALSRGKGNLTLTGKLGDVMQESARAAVSYVRRRAELFGIDADFHASIDIHIHVPEGAIPKDGPSAGITMATALLSAVTQDPGRIATSR